MNGVVGVIGNGASGVDKAVATGNEAGGTGNEEDIGSSKLAVFVGAASTGAEPASVGSEKT
jgi:hypothetical protein